MAYVVAKRATLLMPSGPGEEGLHLYCAVTNPCDQNQCLLVTFSSIKEGRFHDPACVVDVGEHPFVTKPSFIEYRLSRIISCEHVAKCVAGWVFTPKVDVSDDLLLRLQTGIEASDFTPMLVYRYFDLNKHR